MQRSKRRTLDSRRAYVLFVMRFARVIGGKLSAGAFIG